MRKLLEVETVSRRSVRFSKNNDFPRFHLYSLGQILNIRLPSFSEFLRKRILLLRTFHWGQISFFVQYDLTPLRYYIPT